MKIGKSLAEHRKKQNLTQEELAEKIGVSRQAVTKWESNVSVPDIHKLISMAEIFGTSLDKLVGRGDTLYDDLRNVLEKYIQTPRNMNNDEDFIYMAARFMDYFRCLGLTAEQTMEGLHFTIRGSEGISWR